MAERPRQWRPRKEDLEGVRGEPRLGIGQLDLGDENGAQNDEEDIAGLPAGDGSGYERWHYDGAWDDQ